MKVDIFDLLWTEVIGTKFELSFIHCKGKGKTDFIHKYGQIEEDKYTEDQEWYEAVMSAAYAGILQALQ